MAYLCIVEVTCIDVELNRKVALHPLLQLLHRLHLGKKEGEKEERKKRGASSMKNLHGLHLFWVQWPLVANRPPVTVATAAAPDGWIN